MTEVENSNKFARKSIRNILFKDIKINSLQKKMNVSLRVKNPTNINCKSTCMHSIDCHST